MCCEIHFSFGVKAMLVGFYNLLFHIQAHLLSLVIHVIQNEPQCFQILHNLERLNLKRQGLVLYMTCDDLYIPSTINQLFSIHEIKSYLT